MASTNTQQLLAAVLAGAAITFGATFLLKYSNAASSSPRKARVNSCGGGSEDSTDDSTLENGFSNQESSDHNASSARKNAACTPEDVLSRLQRGNSRYWTGRATRPKASAFKRRALLSGQHPTVAVLGCADSRVPVEIVFDQGIGDMFVIRVAGNCLDTGTEGSIEYAVAHLKVKVLIVMGHEGCGAIQAARSPIRDIEKQPTSLGNVLKGIKGGLDEGLLSNISDPRASDREAVVANVKTQVCRLLENKVIKQSVESKRMVVIGAFYEMSSGIVDFF